MSKPRCLIKLCLSLRSPHSFSVSYRRAFPLTSPIRRYCSARICTDGSGWVISLMLYPCGSLALGQGTHWPWRHRNEWHPSAVQHNSERSESVEVDICLTATVTTAAPFLATFAKWDITASAREGFRPLQMRRKSPGGHHPVLQDHISYFKRR